ncbi:MAG: hypothetical protein ABIQ47_10305 [Tepidiformaceae bacterium]
MGFVIEGRTRDAMFKHGAHHDLILMSVLAGELKKQGEATWSHHLSKDDWSA